MFKQIPVDPRGNPPLLRQGRIPDTNPNDSLIWANDMADTAQHDLDTGNRLANYPITFYAITMGLFGLTLTFHAASRVLEWIGPFSDIMLWISLAVFVMITAGYLAKILIHPAAVKAEWNHPVRATFFPAASISLMLMAVCFLPENAGIANILWIIGALLQGALTLAIIGRWIGHKPFEYSHINPAWFIPAVGNVVAPIAGAQLGYLEVSWLFFSGGLLFWIILLTLVMNRLIFHTPLPGKLLPTLVIMIAPPAVAFISYLQLNAEVDTFARILLNLGYVFALIVLTQIPRILKLPFAMSFWALSFPIASLTISSFRYGALAESQAHETIGIILLVVLVAVITVLAIRTLLAIFRGQICLPE